uniref:Uncharacterized protein n=1 Tax=Amazona collaria TaxID=241587 RepID=A0A8B9G5B6_9PSIT
TASLGTLSSSLGQSRDIRRGWKDTTTPFPCCCPSSRALGASRKEEAPHTMCFVALKKPFWVLPRGTLPLLLCHNQLGQVGMQLVLLVDPLLLNAVPTLLLGDAQRAGDVIPKVQPLLLGEVVAFLLTSLQVGDGLVIVFHLHLALAQEEVSLHRLAIELQGSLAVRQRLVVLLHLQVAEGSVCVVHNTHDGAAVAGGGLGVLASAEEPVPLLLVLLRAVALLGAAADPGAPRTRPRRPGPRRAALPLLLPLHGTARPGPARPDGAGGCESSGRALRQQKRRFRGRGLRGGRGPCGSQAHRRGAGRERRRGVVNRRRGGAYGGGVVCAWPAGRGGCVRVMGRWGVNGGYGVRGQTGG